MKSRVFMLRLLVGLVGFPGLLLVSVCMGTKFQALACCIS